MTGLSWEMAGLFLLFQVAQAVTAGTVVGLLLWYGGRASARRERRQGDQS